MNKVIWVIENFLFDKETDELIKIIQQENESVHVVKTEEYLRGLFDILDDKQPILFHGSIQFAEIIQKEKPSWKPGVIADFRWFNCIVWYAHKRQFMLNMDYRFVWSDELLNEKWDIYRTFGKEAKIWIRPNSSKKTFTGGLVDIQDFDNFVHKWIKPINDSVVVSSPKEINGEFRFICTKDEIVTCSTYFYQGLRTFIPSAPSGATKMCETILLDNWKFKVPDKMYAVDICEDKNGNFYLMEYNAFSTCDFYLCNKLKIVRKVNELYGNR